MKYTLLSGASSDIGQAIAHKLAAQHALILSAKDSQKLQALKEELPQNFAHKTLLCDLNDIVNIPSAIYSILKAPEQTRSDKVRGGGAEDKKGEDKKGDVVDSQDSQEHSNITIENFIHCAGEAAFGAIKHFDYMRALESFNVNYFSCCAIIAALLKKPNHNALKNIILISSISAIKGYKGTSIYAGAKAGLDSLARSLCAELADNININSLQLGPIPTRANAYLDTSRLCNNTYAQLTPSDVASWVAYLLACPHGLNGQNITLDGGMSIKGA
ncbi:hypothetical protein BKH46_04860 [Helicobacter sp. 12S02634-8]|uniref:SDR family NAD(P)-dependent oxidoreductase n=1 Tax=Helicobacter sp. 12S02634-8 TaxID=1476199 RepID=UPI000BA7ACD3|nr:SDR family oxidoreductase [Helicobacter sp. 12S02634-8]PAF47054.1 hypothetical protein BKH46_04860 [Helicobacter sp. 12S02634-8]